MSEEDVRRRARQSWQVRKFGPGEAEAMADYDTAFWLQVPVDERAEAVWQLSLALFTLLAPEKDQPDLPRSALRLQRR